MADLTEGLELPPKPDGFSGAYEFKSEVQPADGIEDPMNPTRPARTQCVADFIARREGLLSCWRLRASHTGILALPGWSHKKIPRRSSPVLAPPGHPLAEVPLSRERQLEH